MNIDTDLNQDGRIVTNPDICHGVPFVRGTRIMVWLVLDYLVNGDSIDDVLAAYPSLTREDVSACLAYASKAVNERVVPLEIGTHAF